uniref:Uncharacterized protein n=1 Tax=Candidatus Kentrum sp. DK TaxID=2126562 RepID=A0A450S4Q0_9GAMM|nr:MAG: hypothetical protein BECKDK2373B_GA0170837_101420 [Candidatus Kentron sp. DK]
MRFALRSHRHPTPIRKIIGNNIPIEPHAKVGSCFITRRKLTRKRSLYAIPSRNLTQPRECSSRIPGTKDKPTSNQREKECPRNTLKSRKKTRYSVRDFCTTIRPFLVFCERFWESREASENNYAFLASYSLKIKVGSKNSFSAKLCVLCASAVKKEKIATAEAQSTQSFAEKKNQRVNRNTRQRSDLVVALATLWNK